MPRRVRWQTERGRGGLSGAVCAPDLFEGWGGGPEPHGARAGELAELALRSLGEGIEARGEVGGVRCRAQESHPLRGGHRDADHTGETTSVGLLSLFDVVGRAVRGRSGGAGTGVLTTTSADTASQSRCMAWPQRLIIPSRISGGIEATDPKSRMASLPSRRSIRFPGWGSACKRPVWSICVT